MTSRSLTVAIAALTGFLALSYEILWYRAISCATGGLPASFGMLLAVYLCGLAFGSGISGALCARASRGESSRQLQALASLVGLATVAAWLVCPAFAWTVTQWGDWRPALVAVAVAAALFGSILPLVCHFGIAPDERAGQNLSFVYLANIVGSASGSMVTGFVFMAVWSLRTTSLALALGGIVLMGLVAAQSTRVGRARGLLGGLVLAGGVAFWLATPVLYDRIYERLLYGPTFLPTTRFEQVVETKSGVVAVSQDGTVYGGGAYDGRFNVSLDHDGRKNGVFRAYAVGAMHPAPA